MTYNQVVVCIALAVAAYPAALLYLYVAGIRGGVWEVVRLILLLPALLLATVLEILQLVMLLPVLLLTALLEVRNARSALRKKTRQQ